MRRYPTQLEPANRRRGGRWGAEKGQALCPSNLRSGQHHQRRQHDVFQGVGEAPGAGHSRLEQALCGRHDEAARWTGHGNLLAGPPPVSRGDGVSGHGCWEDGGAVQTGGPCHGQGFGAAAPGAGPWPHRNLGEVLRPSGHDIPDPERPGRPGLPRHGRPGHRGALCARLDRAQVLLPRRVLHPEAQAARGRHLWPK